MTVEICQTSDARDLPLPAYQTAGAAGMDLYANIHEAVTLRKGGRAAVPAGVKVALPEGFEAQIRPRSGLAYEHGVTMMNAPGTVDSDYRGEIRVLLVNLGTADYVIHRGDRIAQMVVAPVARAEWIPVAALGGTERGGGGFGHTGKA